MNLVLIDSELDQIENANLLKLVMRRMLCWMRLTLFFRTSSFFKGANDCSQVPQDTYLLQYLRSALVPNMLREYHDEEKGLTAEDGVQHSLGP
jgi:hypothetical protein